MLKFVIIALGIFVVYKLFANDFLHKKQKSTDQEKKVMEKKAAAGELTKDPVCGTFVSIDDSITVRDGEKVYHFCSYDCRDKFIKELEQGARGLPKGDDKDE